MSEALGRWDWLQEASRGVLDLLYPPRCVVCREPGLERFCAVCRRAIVPVAPPLPHGTQLAGRAGVGRYEGPLREAVVLLKFHDRRGLAGDLGELLVYCLEQQGADWRPDGLVPIPIHPRRRRERGYNQSELLAGALGERCGLPVRLALERVIDTPPQVGLGRHERSRNVCDAFAARADVGPGRRPVLIDDVQTTGATLEAAARMLKVAGSNVVFALTVCWEPLISPGYNAL